MRGLLYRLFARSKVYLPYAAVMLAIMAPLFAPGYIFALDMVFVPTMPFPESVAPHYLPQLLLHYASLCISAAVIQKILLAGILLAAGIGAHRLAQRMQPAPLNRLAPYAAGLLYMVNPFVYSRFMAGQYYVLCGYALLPFFAYLCWQFLRKPAFKSAYKLTLVALLITVTSIHTAGLALLLAVVMGIVTAVHERHDKTLLRRIAGYGGTVVLTLAVLSCYWLVPLAGGNGWASAISTFDAADRQAFATDDAGFGRVGNAAALQGFWADSQSLYLIPQDIAGWWWLPVCALWSLVISGVLWGWGHARMVTITWLAVLAVAIPLASVMRLDSWLAAHMPFFAGYREPQKFVALVALAYALFACYGLHALVAISERSTRLKPYVRIGAVAVLAIPFMCAPYMVWGFGGQLRPADYPASWYAANEVFARNDGNDRVLFLPWHGYMRFGFAGSVVANPAPKFFDAQVISNPDPEFDGAKAYMQTLQQQRAQRLLATAPGRTDFAERLHSAGITYVLVAKELDYQEYDYLAHQTGMSVVMQRDDLTLYEVRR